MKTTVLILTFFLIVCESAVSQLEEARLLAEAQLTRRDLLNIQLQLLSMNLAKESVAPSDVGRLRTPVYIWIDDSLRIAFQMEGMIDMSLSKSKREEIMREVFYKVHVGIRSLMMRQFADIKFNDMTDLIGYWLLPERRERIAKWQAEKVFWISEHIY